MAALEETNGEFQDLLEPLAEDWNLEKLRTLKITLYEMQLSPPCCKMRFLLQYYHVPYTIHSGKKPGSQYQKVPVLDIEERQINDSFIMVKSLAPSLQGRPLTPAEEAIEKEMTAGLMVAAERHSASNFCELCRCAPLAGGKETFLLRLCACCICTCVSGQIGKGKELKPIKEYGTMLRNQLGANHFLGGEDKPSVLDISVFGVLAPWAKVESQVLELLLGPITDPLYAWYDRVAALCTDIDIFP